jgi:putative ABC transport system permease protein
MSTGEGIGLATRRFDRPAAVARGGSNLTLLIAWRNLVHDRLRFAVTLVGIAFSTILVGVQLGMLLNFMRTTSTIVDQAGADLWIAAHGAPSVDLATPIEERRRFQALAVEGVAKAESYFLHFGFWKRTDGIRQIVIVVGVDPNAEMGLPLAMAPGQNVHEALSSPDGIIIDRLYAEKLGVRSINQLVEINDHRARVVGFTEGIRTFTQSPYIFTSLRNARWLLNRTDNITTYVLIRLADGQPPEPVVQALSARMPEVDVLKSHEFSHKSQNYWLLTTGAGITIISSSVLAMLVGVVIVAQTLYASTMDRLPEYAVIRAMGGPRSYLYKIVMEQAVIGGLCGSALGICVVAVLVYLAKNMSSPPLVPVWLALGIGAVTVLMCIGASLVSISKITTIDPVKVFR